MDNQLTRDFIMKSSYALRFIAVTAAALSLAGPLLVQAQTRVGVSIDVHQPGVYGRINIGDLPQPALVYAQPVVVAPPPVQVNRQPIYLYVPEQHAQDWRRYCHRYSACGQPVFFVQDRWIRERYEHQHPGLAHGRHRGGDGHEEHHEDQGERGQKHDKHEKHDKKDRKDKHD